MLRIGGIESTAVVRKLQGLMREGAMTDWPGNALFHPSTPRNRLIEGAHES